jgi:hypothetical protein
MQGIIAKVIEMLIRYAVVPLFSKIIVEIVAYFQAKKEEAERSQKIDEAVKNFKEATTNEEKEAAFLALVRR